MIAIAMTDRPAARLVLEDGASLPALCSWRLREGIAQGADGLPQTFVSLYEPAAGTTLPPAVAGHGARLYALKPLVGQARDGGRFAGAIEAFAAGDLFVVQANALPGEEQAFIDFYRERHLAELLSLDGFEAAMLYETSAPDAPHRFVSLWALDDAARAQASLVAARQIPDRIAANGASDRSASRSGYYQKY